LPVAVAAGRGGCPRAIDGAIPAIAAAHQQAEGYANVKALTIDRVVPYWNETILPRLKSGERVIIAAHGNSLRALVDNVTLVVLFFALINCAYSVFSTVLDAIPRAV
jgi:hypothetical protein